MLDIEVKHPMLEFTKEDVTKILEQYNRTLDNVQEDIDCIQSWIKSQPHFNYTPDDRFVLTFLILNKFAIEKTKMKIDYYYSLRSHLSVIFTDYLPNSEVIKEMRNYCSSFTLSKLIHLNRVAFIVFRGPQERFDGYSSLRKSIMDVETIIYNDINNGFELIADYTDTNLAFWLSFNPMIAKVLVNFVEKFMSNRLLVGRFVGIPSVAQTLMNYGLELLPKKIKERISFHKDRMEIAQFYPSDLVPVEFGGTAKSYKEMSNEFNQVVDDTEPYFQSVNNIKVDEKLRPKPLNNDELLGYYGNFRKLDVD